MYKCNWNITSFKNQKSKKNTIDFTILFWFMIVKAYNILITFIDREN